MDGVNLIGCLSYGVGSHGLVDRDLHKYEHEKHTATLCDYLWAKAISSAYRQFATLNSLSNVMETQTGQGMKKSPINGEVGGALCLMKIAMG